MRTRLYRCRSSLRHLNGTRLSETWIILVQCDLVVFNQRVVLLMIMLIKLSCKHFISSLHNFNQSLQHKTNKTITRRTVDFMNTRGSKRVTFSFDSFITANCNCQLSFTNKRNQRPLICYLGIGSELEGSSIDTLQDKPMKWNEKTIIKHRRIIHDTEKPSLQSKHITLRWISHFFYYSCMVHEL